MSIFICVVICSSELFSNHSKLRCLNYSDDDSGGNFSGSVYLWGDFDQPMPGMSTGTHLRILKITGFERIKPPSYDEASKKPTSPPLVPQGPYPAGTADDGSFPSYPNLGFASSANTQNMASCPQSNAPYPQNNPSYPQSQSFYTLDQTAYPQDQPLQDYPESVPYSQSDNRQNTYQNQSSTPQQPYSGAPGSYYTGQHAYYPPQEKQNCCLQ